MSLDIYKSYAPFYIHLERNKKPTIWRKGEELEIYTNLSQRLLLPRYLLIQFTAYPLATLSSYLETDRYRYYQRFNLLSDVNLIRSIGAGYEEPYAISILLGNILFLVYQDSSSQKLKQSGSALAGFLVSTGGHQIYNNINMADRWYQPELILTGNIQENKRKKLTWNFRLGIKLHQNSFFNHEITMAIERSHSDYKANGWSLVRNSIFKFYTNVPINHGNDHEALPRHLILFGKKFPIAISRYKIFGTFSIGAKWERIRKFDHLLREFEPNSVKVITWIVQPNLEF
ncbi:MAG: hypothetical protein ONB13_01030 [candidate division KSB1 bacterium]|nr:hypothetical protein [candidate division KSB1 bacterium]